MIFDTGAPNKDVGIFIPEVGDELGLEFENDDFPIMEASVKIGNEMDIPVLLFVDIGARVTLMIKSSPSKKIILPKGAEEQSLGSGTQGKVFGKKRLISKLQLGKHTFEAIEVSFVNAEPGPNFPPGCEGILGIQILKKFNLIFDYFNEVIYLKPNDFKI